MPSDKVKYSSKFSNWAVAFLFVSFVASSTCIIILIKIFFKSDFDDLGTTIPIVLLIGVLGFSLYLLLSLKTLHITREYLVVEYLILRKTKQIAWALIEDVERKLMIGNSEDSRFITGDVVVICSKKHKIQFQSFFYRDFDKLLLQMEKRLKHQQKRKMKANHKSEKQAFVKQEKINNLLFDRYFWILIAVCILLITAQYIYN